MRVSGPETPSLIEPEALDELIRALEGKPHDLQIDRVVRLDAAFRALQDGVSLLEIIRGTVWQLEALLIVKVLAFTQGDKCRAARLLKIDHETLYRHIHKYGLWDMG